MILDPYEKRPSLTSIEKALLIEEISWQQVLKNHASFASLVLKLRNSGRKRSFLDLNGQPANEALDNMKSHLKLSKDNDWDVILLMTNQSIGESIIDYLRSIGYQYKWERPNQHETDVSMIMVCLKTKQIIVGAKSVTITDQTEQKRVIDYSDDVMDLSFAETDRQTAIIDQNRYWKIVDRACPAALLILIGAIFALFLILLAKRNFWMLVITLLILIGLSTYLYVIGRKKGKDGRKLRIFLAFK